MRVTTSQQLDRLINPNPNPTDFYAGLTLLFKRIFEIFLEIAGPEGDQFYLYMYHIIFITELRLG